MLFGLTPNCRRLHKKTYDATDRVQQIALAAPRCVCERQRMSSYSPCPIMDGEPLSRFVFSPLHVKKNTGEIKPNAFSHVQNRGCSIQREWVALDEEISLFLRDFFAKNPEATWHAVLQAKCKDVRAISTGHSQRAIAVYDSAEPQNPAHAEMCETKDAMDESDWLEVKRHLFRAFGDGKPLAPSDYRSGKQIRRMADSAR